MPTLRYDVEDTLSNTTSYTDEANQAAWASTQTTLGYNVITDASEPAIIYSSTSIGYTSATLPNLTLTAVGAGQSIISYVDANGNTQSVTVPAAFAAYAAAWAHVGPLLASAVASAGGNHTLLAAAIAAAWPY